MSPSDSHPDLNGLDPRGVLLGALGEASASWPAGGPVAWEPPPAEEVEARFPGYSAVTLLGRGGMGAVYRARQDSLERWVAIKLLPPELSLDVTATERFRREAQALARLSHPNIVAIHDFGQTPDGAFYFVMECVEGTDLQRLIREGRLPLTDALEVVRQVCDALEFAHHAGFVHRDIKPANILLGPGGRVKVTDFGLSRFLSEPAGEGLTGGIVGTPEYIAPEQRRGSSGVDHRADIYSLGVMLYEMLTGSLPCGAFEPPSRRAGTAEALDHVVVRAMQEAPADRYQHAAEVKADVARAAGHRPLRWRWAVAAALMLGTAAMAWGLHAASRPEPSPSAGPRTSSQGQAFLPSGTPGILMAAGETSRGEYEPFVWDTGRDRSGEIRVPQAGEWISVQGTWRNPPGIPPQTTDHPVVAVSQDDAMAFCEWLTLRDRRSGILTADECYRLPAAAEWLTAAGRTGAPVWEHEADSGPVVQPGASPGPPVVDRALRGFGGGVAEWTDSVGQSAGERLVCGLSWLEAATPPDAAVPVRSYARSLRGIALGFRIVLDLGSPDVP